ncbi:MAG: iron-only hydrogenase system regulator [Clostridiales bacterium]|nr:iron-only hydrogenase system regulator [Clostridiales bacterium]
MPETRLAIISIIVEDRGKSVQINALLSEFGEFIVGRMGIPYRERNLSVMCVVVDAPAEIINKLTGKIGMLEGVSAKTLMTKSQ